MSPIALGMDLVLAALLLLALGLGARLDRRLKALREGQAQFVGAVADLDRAAQRAEHGLAELRAATEETVDLLAGRIEKARELAARLDGLTAEAARPVARPSPAAAPRPAPARAAPPRAPDPADAAAEELVLRLTERQMLSATRPVPTEPRPEPRVSPRSRASVDDDLFESGPRPALGGRR